MERQLCGAKEETEKLLLLWCCVPLTPRSTVCSWRTFPRDMPRSSLTLPILSQYQMEANHAEFKSRYSLVQEKGKSAKTTSSCLEIGAETSGVLPTPGNPSYVKSMKNPEETFEPDGRH